MIKLTPNFRTIITVFTFLTVSFSSFSQHPDINVPESGNVGNVAITIPTDFTFTIENTHSGGGPSGNKLTVSGITVSGTNAAEFVVSEITFPIVIDRGSSTTFVVTLTAAASGNRIATLDIDSDAVNVNPLIINLLGFGDSTFLGLTLTNTYDLNPTGAEVLEPSGLAYNSATDELFTVSDNTGFVYIISTTGVIQQTLKYVGVDLEGVSMYTSNKILIAVEGSRELVEYDYVVDDANIFTSHVMTYLNTDLSATGDNSRIEGVTYDAINDEIYFLNEKNPGALIKADGNFSVITEYPDPLAHGGDYSGSCYVPETGELWLASDQTSTIYRCTTNGTVIQSFPVTQSGGAPIDKLEGIAIDYANQLIYAVSDLGENLFVFDIYDNVLSNAQQTIEHEGILVYPNPVKDHLNIKLKNSEIIEKIRIHDTLGRVVASVITDSTIFDTNMLNSGVYFLEIYTDINIYKKMIIVEK